MGSQGCGCLDPETDSHRSFSTNRTEDVNLLPREDVTGQLEPVEPFIFDNSLDSLYGFLNFS